MGTALPGVGDELNLLVLNGFGGWFLPPLLGVREGAGPGGSPGSGGSRHSREGGFIVGAVHPLPFPFGVPVREPDPEPLIPRPEHDEILRWGEKGQERKSAWKRPEEPPRAWPGQGRGAGLVPVLDPGVAPRAARDAGWAERAPPALCWLTPRMTPPATATAAGCRMEPGGSLGGPGRAGGAGGGRTTRGVPARRGVSTCSGKLLMMANWECISSHWSFALGQVVLVREKK